MQDAVVAGYFVQLGRNGLVRDHPVRLRQRHAPFPAAPFAPANFAAWCRRKEILRVAGSNPVHGSKQKYAMVAQSGRAVTPLFDLLPKPTQVP